jgi:hypothetical protein
VKCSATTLDGRPCPANAMRSSDPPRCPMHGDDALRWQKAGAIASRLRRAMPSTYGVPEFTSVESIIAFAHELARLALTEDVDPRRVAEARGAAALALSGYGTLEQKKLVDALLRIEHGGAAFALLARLQDGLTVGPRRPLPGPGRVSLLAPEGDAS